MTPPVPAVCFVTLGCPKNEVDSDRMAAAVQASAYRLVDDPADADVVVLNTCAFIQDATEESIAEAFAFTGEWRPMRDGRRVVVAGCLASRYGDELVEAMPEPDAFVPVADEPRLLTVLEALLGTPARPSAPPPRTAPGPTAYLKVSEGCDRRCAYCAIPAIRGRFVSMPADEVIAEARFLIDGGAREIVLVGQDIARWGHDLPGSEDLGALVARLDALPGDFRIRLMYLQPDGVTDRLLDAMAGSSHVCHYLDIPLQHASESVLRAMGRSGDASAHLTLIGRIRAAMPDAVLRTTVMAGFPGETAADFRVLEDFIETAGFDYVGVFAYSQEEGTRAASLPGQVRPATRRARAQRLRDRADRISVERFASHTDTLVRVLVEGAEDDTSWGRTCGQAPDVDGIVVLDRIVPSGVFVDARIVDSFGYELSGEVL